MLSDMFNTGAAARRAQKFPWAASVWINLLSVLLSFEEPNGSLSGDVKCFIDARELPSEANLEGDVCIVGGGAAGISTAREFVNTRHRVILLESTAISSSTRKHRISESQAKTSGENIGTQKTLDFGCVFLVETQTIGVAGAQCHILLDFEARPDIKYSGWPFPLTHLEPWYNRAKRDTSYLDLMVLHLPTGVLIPQAYPRPSMARTLTSRLCGLVNRSCALVLFTRSWPRASPEY